MRQQVASGKKRRRRLKPTAEKSDPKSLIRKQLEQTTFLYEIDPIRYNGGVRLTGHFGNPIVLFLGPCSMPNRSVLARFLTTPENRSAWSAIQELLHAFTHPSADQSANPLFLHGPAGTGKTRLVNVLVDELREQDFRVCTLSANDFAAAESFQVPPEARQADLLVVEDLQHLPTRYAESLVQILDDRRGRERPTVFTALTGPSHLSHRGSRFPPRLTTRLAAGLVVALEPLQAPSRRRLLDLLAEAAPLPIDAAILDWLAEHLTGGGRQLEGAIRQLQTLQRLHRKPLRLEDIRGHFRTQIEATAPTVERIAEHVGACYQVQPKQMRSAQRSREVMLPRQVSMYLARQLTNLSLQQIGQYFGGRDHKTVQHACKKVAAAIKSDRALSGVVRRMHAELA